VKENNFQRFWKQILLPEKEMTMRTSLCKWLLCVTFLCCTLMAAQAQNWDQWALDPQHTGNDSAVVGQTPNRILANIVYDSLVPQEQAVAGGDLLVHYQVPLVNGNNVYMESKSGAYDTTNLIFSAQTWGENGFMWVGADLVQIWSFTSDWKAPGNLFDFWEPVFHAAVANGFVYVPGGNGTIYKLDATTGTVVKQINPFDSIERNRYTVSPITVDSGGNLFYNVIQVPPQDADEFYAKDAVDSWIVKVTPSDAVSRASYSQILRQATIKGVPAGEITLPSSNDPCEVAFSQGQLPWPPSPTAVPGTTPCGTQRVALNVAPAIAPDGTIYSVTRGHFVTRYNYLVAINPDLSGRWAASMRGKFTDGCNPTGTVPGSIMPSDPLKGGCRANANLGVDPQVNHIGMGRVLDDQSSTPTVLPDGSILFGAYTAYNYAQGHLMKFSANGDYLGVFNFGWDSTDAVRLHDGTYSIVVKNNHYGGGAYCDPDPSSPFYQLQLTYCPEDRTANNPSSPEEYFISQLNSNLNLEWSFKSTNTESCTRHDDGTISCVSDHPRGFEWCVNAPVIDRNGLTYVNSEDGNIYVLNPNGTLNSSLFQQLAIGAAYTPTSLGPDGKIYSQNAGHLFVAGR
jgi:outer membrane protein assembly factor BamB